MDCISTFFTVNRASICVFGRRVLEMCCFMEKMLASMLADFEMKVEKDVLEPLNKLSEVSAACFHLLQFTTVPHRKIATEKKSLSHW